MFGWSSALGLLPLPLTPNPALSQKVLERAAPPQDMPGTTPTGYLR